GLNGRGGAHVGEWLKMKNVQITYLIDPDTRTYAKHLKNIAGKDGGTPKTVQDVREALQDKNLDAISIATPNHWHALMTIWAGPAAALPREPRPLPLALVLGLRQRRHRQPGRPPDGRRPLDDPRRHAAQDRPEPGRPARPQGPGSGAQHAARLHGLRRHGTAL